MAVRAVDLPRPRLEVVPEASRSREPAPLAAASVVVAVVIGFLAGSAGAGGATADDRRGRAIVRVHDGDTLWDVAARHAPPGIDPRAYVDALIEVNDVTTAVRGTRLRLP